MCKLCDCTSCKHEDNATLNLKPLITGSTTTGLTLSWWPHSKMKTANGIEQNSNRKALHDSAHLHKWKVGVSYCGRLWNPQNRNYFLLGFARPFWIMVHAISMMVSFGLVMTTPSSLWTCIHDVPRGVSYRALAASSQWCLQMHGVSKKPRKNSDHAQPLIVMLILEGKCFLKQCQGRYAHTLSLLSTGFDSSFSASLNFKPGNRCLRISITWLLGTVFALDTR